MKSWITIFFLFLSLMPLDIYGQSFGNKIFFSAEKEGEIFCGEMIPISISPQMTDPYDQVHFMVQIGGDLISTVQGFWT